MNKPTVQVIGPNSASEVLLAWDTPNTYWDSGLYWDSNTYQADKLVPIINIQSDSVDIGVV